MISRGIESNYRNRKKVKNEIQDLETKTTTENDHAKRKLVNEDWLFIFQFRISTVITQNVDGLHHIAGSGDVIEIPN
ncbi:MAG: hypothetical protein WBZ36_08145 [Candidatus Nitrosopolaris sp.]